MVSVVGRAMNRRLIFTSALTPLAAIINTATHSQINNYSSTTLLASISGDNKFDVKSLFKDDMQTINYAIYRPTYPDALYDIIYKYSKTGRFDAAADLATGSGQAAKALAKSFNSVIGIDVSIQQLQNTNQGEKSNILYMEGSAEETKLPGSSLDLVTVAQALHWFDLPSFYAEAHRVLRVNGTLAIWGYGDATIVPSEGLSEQELAVTAAANRLLAAIYNNEPLGPHWDDRRRLVDSRYAGLEPNNIPSAYPLFYDVQRHDSSSLSIVKQMPLADLVGYVRTWSSYTTYMKKNKVEVGHSDRDPAELFHRELHRVYRVDIDQPPREVRVSWPLFLILAARK